MRYEIIQDHDSNQVPRFEDWKIQEVWKYTIRLGRYNNRSIKVLGINILTNLTQIFHQGGTKSILLIEAALQDWGLEHIF